MRIMWLSLFPLLPFVKQQREPLSFGVWTRVTWDVLIRPVLLDGNLLPFSYLKKKYYYHYYSLKFIFQNLLVFVWAKEEKKNECLMCYSFCLNGNNRCWYRSEFGAGRISWCSSAECHEERGSRYGPNSPTTSERRYTISPLLHSVLVDYNIPGIFYLSKNLFVGAICVSTRRQVTSSRIQRRYIYDSNLAFGKFYFFIYWIFHYFHLLFQINMSHNRSVVLC